jgi:hypothetical protein
MSPFLTRQRLADIRLILGFDLDVDLSIAEVEDYLRAREKMIAEAERTGQKNK